jgi:hypothetical protein
LFSSTSRPVWQRVAPPTLALVITVTVAFLLLIAAGVPKVLPTATYFNPSVLAMAAVGLIALVAAAVVGMAVGRMLPSPFTAPALGVAGMGVMLGPSLQSPLKEQTGRTYELLVPRLSASFSDFFIVSDRVNAVQSIWMASIAVTGVLLLVAAGRRQRILSVLPMLLGAAIVIPILPHGEAYRISYVPDVGAQALVCADGAPRVCVRQVHAALLPEVVGPARQALQRMAALPGPPTSAVEEVYLDAPPTTKPDASTMEFFAEMNADGRLDDPAALDLDLHDVERGSACDDEADYVPIRAARLAAAFLLLGREPSPGQGADVDPLIADAYRTVAALPETQRRERLSAVRTAFLTCAGDPYAALTGGTR